MHRRLTLLFLAAAATPFLLVAARLAADGVTYSFTMTTVATDDRGRSRDVNSMSGKAHVTSEYARMDIEASKNQPMMERGSYLIMRAEPATFFMVNPRKKEYVEFPVGEMARGLTSGAGGAGGMIRIEVSDASTRGEKVGSGGEVDGQQTELYRITQEYKMSVRVLGRRNTTTNKSVADYYVAPQLSGLLNPLGSFAKGMSAMVASPGGGEGGDPACRRSSTRPRSSSVACSVRVRPSGSSPAARPPMNAGARAKRQRRWTSATSAVEMSPPPCSRCLQTTSALPWRSLKPPMRRPRRKVSRSSGVAIRCVGRSPGPNRSAAAM